VRFLTNADGLLRILKGFPQIIFGGRFFDSKGEEEEEEEESILFPTIF
jgi:hypothetical protein